MADKIKLGDEELDQITGGDITYTWNGESGTIGINGFNPFILVDKAKFVSYYDSVHGKMSDAEILQNLIASGAVKVK